VVGRQQYQDQYNNPHMHSPLTSKDRVSLQTGEIFQACY
jgi:hypothetical protein